MASPVGALAGLSSPSVTDNGGTVYRGDRRGKIYASRDQGATWALHTALGGGYAVNRLGIDRNGRVTAIVAFRGRRFGLVLAPDGTRWLTA